MKQSERWVGGGGGLLTAIGIHCVLVRWKDRPLDKARSREPARTEESASRARHELWRREEQLAIASDSRFSRLLHAEIQRVGLSGIVCGTHAPAWVRRPGLVMPAGINAAGQKERSDRRRSTSPSTNVTPPH